MKFNEIKKIFNNKKAVNDVSIISIILSIFILTALILPFVNQEFNAPTTNFNTDGISTGLVGENINDVSSVGVGDILVSVGKVFFWTFGDLPFWLDAVFVVLRILLLFMLIRNFTPFLGGGG